MLNPADTRLHEQAFTLVEVVVALVLAAIVFGVTGTVVATMVQGGSSSNTARTASIRTSQVLRAFERDVRFAQSPDVLDHPRVGDDLRGMLLWGASRTPAGAIVTTTPDQCDTSTEIALRDYCEFEDITRATHTELWVRSDVRNAGAADNGTECVRWEVDQAGALWRRVHRAGPAPDCRKVAGSNRVGALVEEERMLDAPPTAATGNAEGRSASFGYLVVWNPTASASTVGAIVDPKSCASQQTSFTAGPTGRQRTFVSTITLDLTTFTSGANDTASRNHVTGSASLQGRATDDYARAAGCAY